jgi:tetratricopeptide (TPR) repeat protein
MSTRLDKLKELQAEDPDNVLLTYGLAQELANLGRLEESADQYAHVIAKNPSYCAAYFHGARTLERLGRTEDARGLYRRGIAAAAQSGDQHARSEMEAALAELK